MEEDDDYDADFGADIRFMTPSTVSAEEFESVGMKQPQEDLSSAFSTLRVDQEDENIPTLRASSVSHRHLRNKSPIKQQQPSQQDTSLLHDSFDDAFSGAGLNLKIPQQKRQLFRPDDMQMLLEEDFDDGSSLGIRRGHRHSPSTASTATTSSSGTFDSENDDYDSVLGFGPADTSLSNNNISLRQIRDAKVQKYHLETERLRAARLAQDRHDDLIQKFDYDDEEEQEQEDYSQFLAIGDRDARLTVRARAAPPSSLAGTMRMKPALSITRQQQQPQRRLPLSGSIRQIPSVTRLGQSFAGGGRDMFHDDNNALLTISPRRAVSGNNQQQQRLRNVSSMYQLRTPSMSRTRSSAQLQGHTPFNLTGSLRTPRRYTRPPNRRSYFGDGSELDDIADLPIRNEDEFLVTAQSTPRGNKHPRHSYGSYSKYSEDRTPRGAARMNRNVVQTSVPLSRRASRAEFYPEQYEASTLNGGTNNSIGVGQRRRKKRRAPQLIRRLGDNGPEDVNGMRFNKELNIWEGNEGEIDLLEFETSDVEDELSTIRPKRTRQKKPRRQPALISNMNASKAVHVVGNMLFDPDKRCWVKIRGHSGVNGEEDGDDEAGFDDGDDDDDDPFEGIEDLSEDQLSIESQERLAEVRAAGRRRKDMQYGYYVGQEQERDSTLNANEQFHHRPLPRLRESRSIDPSRVPVPARLGQRASCSVMQEGITPSAFQLSEEFRQREFTPDVQFVSRLQGWLVGRDTLQQDMRIIRMKQLVDSLTQGD